MADYPAAHSMDVQWYAVDRDGQVAVFSSGEAGAVPRAAFADMGYEDETGDLGMGIEEWLRQNRPRGDVVYDPVGRVMPGDESVRSDPYFGRPPFVLFLTTLDPVREALASGQAEEIPATTGVAVLFRELDEEALQRYLHMPECTGHFNLYCDEAGVSDSSARLGLYVYSHITENWISGPYGREEVPLRPLHIDELPPNLRDLVGAMRFDVRFAETAHLQPVEHAECESWESAYIDVTGQHIRPIPGKEQGYADSYDELADDEGRFQVEPPPE